MRLQVFSRRLRSSIVHQIRNSVKYVASKNQKEFKRDLKLVYQTVNKDAAEKALDDLEIKWDEDYPIVIKSWRDNWDRQTTFFSIHSISGG